MSGVQYMNVWRMIAPEHQWTDGPAALGDRKMADAVARSVERDFPHIRRVGVLRIKAKGDAA